MKNIKELETIDESTINPNDYNVEQLLEVQEEEEDCNEEEFKFSFE